MPKILIIEDDPIFRKRIEKSISLHFPLSKIFIAENIEQGIEKFRLEEPNVILLDMHLPDFTGLDFLNSIEYNPLSTSYEVIVITADDSTELANKIFKSGVISFLRKSCFDFEISGLITNIIAKKKLQKESNEHKAKLNAMFDSSDRAIFLLNNEYKVQEYNYTARYRFEFRFSNQLAVQQADVRAFFQVHLPEVDIEEYLNAAFEGERLDFEFPSPPTENGYVRWINAALTPSIFNEVNKVEQVMLSFKDFTSEKNTMNNIAEANSELNKYKYALDQSAIIAITDSQGTILSANQNFINISGYSVNEIIGNTHRIINSGYHSRHFFINLWKTIISGKIWRGEIKNRAKNGTYYWVDTTITPFLDENEKPERYLAIRFLITDRKQQEAELNEYKEKLEQLVDEKTKHLEDEIILRKQAEDRLGAALQFEKELSQIKSRFVNLISHEFRTPLTNIMNAADISLLYFDKEVENLNEKTRVQLDKINENVKQLTQILKVISNFFQIQKRVFEVVLDNVDIIELLQIEVETYFENRVSKRQINYSFDINNHKILSSVELLKLIFFNLLDNAVTYSPADKPININVIETGTHIRIEFEDFGKGIDEQELEYVFEPFRRGKDEENIGGKRGLGLGLAIIKICTEALAGEITVKSQKNIGSSFAINLPK